MQNKEYRVVQELLIELGIGLDTPSLIILNSPASTMGNLSDQTLDDVRSGYIKTGGGHIFAGGATFAKILGNFNSSRPTLNGVLLEFGDERFLFSSGGRFLSVVGTDLDHVGQTLTIMSTQLDHYNVLGMLLERR